jgi:hypothetical protein
MNRSLVRTCHSPSQVSVQELSPLLAATARCSIGDSPKPLRHSSADMRQHRGAGFVCPLGQFDQVWDPLTYVIALTR